MNTSDLIAHFAKTQGIPKHRAHDLVYGLLDSIVAGLESHGRVRLQEVGTLYLKDVDYRQVLMPAQGKNVEVPAHRKVMFRVSRNLKAKFREQSNG